MGRRHRQRGPRTLQTSNVSDAAAPALVPGLRIRAAGLLWPLAVWLAVVPITWVEYGTNAIIGLDGYYHIRYAQLLRLAGPRLAIPFPWLPTTILNPKDFLDHHLLYHLLLIPFTLRAGSQLTDAAASATLIADAKLAAVLFAAAAIFVWFLIARAEGVRLPLLWLTLLLGSSSAFLYRLSMTRRQSVVLLLLLLAVHLVLTRRWRWLIPLGFAFFWVYDGWPVLMAVVAMGCIGLAAEHRRADPVAWLVPPLGAWALRRAARRGQPPRWSEVLLGPAAFLGVVLGTVVNPFFPNTVLFPIRHLLPKLTFSPESSIARVGSEWYPYTFSQLLDAGAVAVAMPLVGLLLVLWLWRSERRLDARLAAWALCAVMFLVLYLRSRRFVEYEPAFAAMFLAVAWTLALGARRPRATLLRHVMLLRPTWPPGSALALVGVLVAAIWIVALPIPRVNEAAREYLSDWQEATLTVLALLAAIGWAALLVTREDQARVAPARVGRRPARREAVSAPREVPTWLPALLLAVPLALAAASSARRDTAGTDSATLDSGAGTWLAKNTLPYERVYSTDWDDFPRLFFWDTNNTYLVGLDPTYMSLYDQDLYLRWQQIGRGNVNFTAQEIRTRFGARWIFTDTKHEDFLKKALATPGLTKVYEDDEAIVFYVNTG
jgi:hypothetical protein